MAWWSFSSFAAMLKQAGHKPREAAPGPSTYPFDTIHVRTNHDHDSRMSTLLLWVLSLPVLSRISTGPPPAQSLHTKLEAKMLLTRLSSSSCSSTALQRHACTTSTATGKALFRGAGCWKKREKLPGFRARVAVEPPCATLGKDGIVPAGNDDDGVNLGTVKLPGNIDIARFESLLFQVSVPALNAMLEAVDSETDRVLFWTLMLFCWQWGNSLCQGANLPLPVPLKVRGEIEKCWEFEMTRCSRFLHLMGDFHVRSGGQDWGRDQTSVHRSGRRRYADAGLHRLPGFSGSGRLRAGVPSDQERSYEGQGATWGAQDHEKPPPGSPKVYSDCTSLTV